MGSDKSFRELKKIKLQGVEKPTSSVVQGRGEGRFQKNTYRLINSGNLVDKVYREVDHGQTKPIVVVEEGHTISIWLWLSHPGD